MKVKELPIFTQCMNFHHSIFSDDFTAKKKGIEHRKRGLDGETIRRYYLLV